MNSLINQIIEQSPKVLVDGASFAMSKNLILILIKTGAGHNVFAIEPHVAKEMMQVFMTTISMFEAQNGKIPDVSKPMLSPIDWTKPPEYGDDKKI